MSTRRYCDQCEHTMPLPGPAWRLHCQVFFTEEFCSLECLAHWAIAHPGAEPPPPPGLPDAILQQLRYGGTVTTVTPPWRQAGIQG